ncbi:hypothetical protein GR7B_00051 [Vibrio phage vB_VcorM_GR7B]|nr:hypothetical protein GR7B_00051 [Vibrio phage vB_VcorM_GR7B]
MKTLDFLSGAIVNIDTDRSAEVIRLAIPHSLHHRYHMSRVHLTSVTERLSIQDVHAGITTEILYSSGRDGVSCSVSVIGHTNCAVHTHKSWNPETEEDLLIIEEDLCQMLTEHLLLPE